MREARAACSVHEFLSKAATPKLRKSVPWFSVTLKQVLQQVRCGNKINDCYIASTWVFPLACKCRNRSS